MITHYFISRFELIEAKAIEYITKTRDSLKKKKKFRMVSANERKKVNTILKPGFKNRLHLVDT